MGYAARDLETSAMRKMLEWHAGHAIQCPSCGCSLDHKYAVQIEFFRGSDPDDIIASRILCARCYDASSAGYRLTMALEGTGLMVRRTDGRQLFWKADSGGQGTTRRTGKREAISS